MHSTGEGDFQYDVLEGIPRRHKVTVNRVFNWLDELYNAPQTPFNSCAL